MYRVAVGGLMYEHSSCLHLMHEVSYVTVWSPLSVVLGSG